MNKPPETIRVHFDELGTMIAVETRDGGFGRTTSRNGKLTEHFYTLEKEPMEKKTENLTVQEAWAAMARGECVKTAREIFYLYNGRVLKYWDGHFWANTSALGGGPYSIVPDPSEPKEVEDEYKRDRKELILNFCRYNAPGVNEDHLIEFIEKHFQRKP